MSIEQIIILILFVVIPIVQSLRRKWNEAREASLRTEHVEEPEEPTFDFPSFPERPAPEPFVPTPELPAPPPRVRSAPVPLRTEPPARVVPAPRVRSERRRAGTRIVPTGRENLRHVMALTAIFGPPRALDPY